MEVENTIKNIKELIKLESSDELKEFLLRIPAVDMGESMREFSREERKVLFSTLSTKAVAEILSTHSEEFASDLAKDKSDDELADLLSLMATDDATDFLDYLEDSDRVRNILKFTLPEKRSALERLLNFDEESAGGIMTTEISAFPANIRVADVMKNIASSEHKDPLMYIYVYAPRTETFMGSVSLTTLIAADPESYIDTHIEKENVWAKSDADQEEVAYSFRKHRLWVMPVVDDQHRLIGRITADDIIDVAFDEADEDIAQLTGAPDLVDRDTRLTESVRLRLPWLFITMSLAFINAIVIDSMMTKVGTIVALAAFVPVIMSMGGNTGMQCAAIFIREIALGGMRHRNASRILWRETLTGFIMGIACGFAAGVLGWLYLTFINNSNLGELSPIILSVIIFLSVTSAMTFSSFMGSVIPMLLVRIEIDPAVAAGPFVTTLNDITGTVIYFLITYGLMAVFQ